MKRLGRGAERRIKRNTVAVASDGIAVFGLELADAGVPGAKALTPLAFLVILATVAVYGLTTAPVARRLGVAKNERAE